jgi:hypothetical protein
LLRRNNDLVRITKQDGNHLNLRLENPIAAQYHAVCNAAWLQKGRKDPMRNIVPLYEGDGYLHYRGPATRKSAEPSDVRAIEQRARALRREEIAVLLRRAVEWFEAKLRDSQRQDVEDYLAKATDHADLERRMRDVERRTRLEYC